MGLYNTSIVPDTTPVVILQARVNYEFKVNVQAIHIATNKGCVGFNLRYCQRNVVQWDKVSWDYYTEVTARQLLVHLFANWSSLHEINAVEIQGSVMEFYVEEEGIPHFINIMEEGQDKTSWGDLPIDDKILHAIAIRVLLAWEDYTTETYKWEKRTIAQNT